MERDKTMWAFHDFSRLCVSLLPYASELIRKSFPRYSASRAVAGEFVDEAAGESWRNPGKLEGLQLAPGEEAAHQTAVGAAGVGIGNPGAEELIGGNKSVAAGTLKDSGSCAYFLCGEFMHIDSDLAFSKIGSACTFVAKHSAPAHTRRFESSSDLYFIRARYLVIGQNNVVSGQTLSCQRVCLIKFVAQFRHCEFIFCERGEFALNGRFPRRRIIAVPAADKSTVAAGIISRKKVLDRPPEAFLSRSHTQILKGLPAKTVQRVVRFQLQYRADATSCHGASDVIVSINIWSHIAERG